MTNMKSWMLGAAIVTGAAGLGATTAQAAEFGVYVRGPVAYVPPCPGPGYVWTAGYMYGGYCVPGRWSLAGYVDRGRFEHRDFYRDRDDFRRGRDFDRHDRDRDHFRR